MISALASAVATVTGLARTNVERRSASVEQAAVAPERVAVVMPALAVPLGATITVNSTDDVLPVNGSDGKCTLREAITAANTDTASGIVGGECAAGSGDDTITFDLAGAGPHTIQLTQALPGLNSNIDIQGPADESVAVLGEGTADPYSIFTILNTRVVSISRLTISNGSVRGADGNNGGLGLGGGIFNAGTLTITNCIISQNSATGGNGINQGGIGRGGGIYSSGTVTITNSTISDNNATAGNSANDAGGSGQGGGIFSSGTVTITNSTISGNKATGGTGPGSQSVGGGSGDGGGIYNQTQGGTLTITNSTISQNSATGGLNSGAGQGAGILNFGTVKITNSNISGNKATGGNGGGGGNSAGGGISSFRTLTITNSIISGNSTTGGDGNIVGGAAEGGGIIYTGDVLTITNSIISGNKATGGNGTATGGSGGFGVGGGISNNQNRTMTITNSTISQNSATGGTGNGADSGPARGGGIFSFGTTTLTNDTISGNSATGSLNTLNAGGGGGIHTLGGTVNVGNTIIAGNSATPKGPDAFGTFASQGHNLIGKNDDSNFPAGNPNASQDIVGISTAPIDPRLGPLASNGGPTQTHALLPGSPALDGGSNALIPQDIADLDGDSDTTEPVPFDQRGPGYARKADAADADIVQTVDIGAFEAHPSIEDITDKTINEDGGLSYSFNYGDRSLGLKSVTFSSSNTALVPNHNILCHPFASSCSDLIVPAADQSGSALITITLTANNDATTSDSFNLTVNPVNDAPTLDALGNLTINEDAPLQTVNLSGITAGGGESQTLVLTATSSNTSLIPNPTVNYTSPNATGSLTFTPVAGQSGSALITVTLTDDGGTANGGANTITRTFTVTVNAVNDAPVNTVPGPLTTNENTALTFSAANLIAVSDVDAGAAGLQVTLTATNGTLTLSTTTGLAFTTGDGTADATMTFTGTIAGINTALSGMTFTPTPGYHGAASVQITTNDQGNTGAGGALSDSDTVQITIIERALQFGSATYNAGEASGRATISVTRLNGSAAPASVDYETSDLSGLNNCNVFTGTASARCDYTAVAGTLNFIAGQSTATFDVPLVNDVYVEGPETLTITLSNPTGDILGTSSTATLTITDDDTTPGAANPIDNRAFFVRQHYMDVLNREPEAQGLADWLAILNNCPAGNKSCDLIQVSSGFFRSPEAFERAYFIYRFYETALGRKPDYDEYQRDLRQVAGFLTNAELEASKAEFAEDFSRRPEFKALYDSKANGDEYVNAIVATAGVVPSNRTNVAIRQGSLVITRGQALRELLESPEISQRFFNEAFVVVGYFAYLRRDPDALYLVWIDKLNHPTAGQTFEDTYRQMIEGFIGSQEYRSRFGLP